MGDESWGPGAGDQEAKFIVERGGGKWEFNKDGTKVSISSPPLTPVPRADCFAISIPFDACLFYLIAFLIPFSRLFHLSHRVQQKTKEQKMAAALAGSRSKKKVPSFYLF